MTPTEHITEAERSLAVSENTSGTLLESEVMTELLRAIGHALVALAVEAGVPHAGTTSGAA